jgi:hypothetical protein
MQRRLVTSDECGKAKPSTLECSPYDSLNIFGSTNDGDVEPKRSVLDFFGQLRDKLICEGVAGAQDVGKIQHYCGLSARPLNKVRPKLLSQGTSRKGSPVVGEGVVIGHDLPPLPLERMDNAMVERPSEAQTETRS